MKSAAAMVNVSGVDVRVKRQARGGLKVAVEHDADGVLAIVDEAERRHGSGRQPEVRHQPLGRREAQLAVADLLGHRLQIGLLRRGQHHEVVPVPFLVPQKEVLAVRRVDARPMRRRLLDGRDRRMLVPRKRNRRAPRAARSRALPVRSRWLSRLWKPPERGQQLEARAAERVFGDADGGVRVARAALGVDHLDVGRGAGAEADVDDVDDLLRLIGGGPRAGEAALGARDRLARGPHFRPRLRLRAA